MWFGIRKQLRWGAISQFTACQGLEILAMWHPLFHTSTSQLWWALPDLVPLCLWTVPQLLLPKEKWATGLWCIGWWPWDPSGQQLSSDRVFPGFQAHASLSSLGKSKYSIGSCSYSVLCSLQTAISICLSLVWCPALSGCYFTYNGRSEEGSRARCSAGIDQHWCVYISEMLLF